AQDPPHFQRLSTNWLSIARCQLLRDIRSVCGINPYFKPVSLLFSSANYLDNTLVDSLVTNLKRLHSTHVNSGSRKQLIGFRPCYPNGTDRSSKIAEFHFIHNDEAPQGGQQRLRLIAISFQQQGLAAIKNVQVAQNPSLSVQNKVVSATVEWKVANIVRDHIMQPPHAILAAQVNQSAPVQTENSTARLENLQLLLWAREAESGLHTQVAAGF